MRHEISMFFAIFKRYKGVHEARHFSIKSLDKIGVNR